MGAPSSVVTSTAAGLPLSSAQLVAACRLVVVGKEQEQQQSGGAVPRSYFDRGRSGNGVGRREGEGRAAMREAGTAGESWTSGGG
jgi:hypothetical protein